MIGSTGWYGTRRRGFISRGTSNNTSRLGGIPRDRRGCGTDILTGRIRNGAHIRSGRRIIIVRVLLIGIVRVLSVAISG